MRSNRDNVSQAVLAVEVQHKESKSDSYDHVHIKERKSVSYDHVHISHLVLSCLGISC